MKEIKLQKKQTKIEDYIKRSAVRSDFTTLITEPCVCTEGGEIKIIYDLLDWDFSQVVPALERLKFTEGKRMRGLKSASRIFGFRPRNEIRQDYCSTTSLATDHPKEHALICSFAKKIEEIYFQKNPELYTKHKETISKVKGAWRIDDSLFTSGIVNKNSALKYHFDTGNFNEVFSAMLVFKNDVEGGYLSLPEYDIGFELKSGSLFLFDGQGILHGVTPIKYRSAKGFRFSIVFYSLKKMWKCLEITEELIRIRKKKTEREKNRLRKEHTEGLKERYGKQ